MNSTTDSYGYVLGSTDAEHARLRRQAARLAPFTERVFRDAGITVGQRVLDLGSGVGDVAMLTARLVGPTGEVVGIDRDNTALAKARARASDAGLGNVRFVETDISTFTTEAPFDAVVGRMVLQFLPDPVGALRSLAAHVKGGGLFVFHEVSWASFMAQSAHLPLRFACASLVMQTLQRSGARTDMPLVLYQAFTAIGLAAPTMRLETSLGNDAETRRWIYDLFCTVRNRADQLAISAAPLGNLETLFERLEAELDAAQSFASDIGLVGAWSRKP